jgi:hypothetical protein
MTTTITGAGAGKKIEEGDSDFYPEKKASREGKGISTASSIQSAAPAEKEASVLKLPDGSQYRGPFLDGKPHGKGLQISPNGDSYDGAFLNGIREGHGTFEALNGERYVGDFSGDKYHGKGELFLPGGKEKYVGDFVAGEFKKGKHYPDFKNFPEKFEEYTEVPGSRCVIS